MTGTAVYCGAAILEFVDCVRRRSIYCGTAILEFVDCISIRGLRYVHCGIAGVYTPILEFEDCGDAVSYIAPTQRRRKGHQASHNYGTIGALLCNP